MGQRHVQPIFTPGKDPVSIVQEAGRAPGPVWTGTENPASTGIRSRTVQPLTSRYTDWATGPTPLLYEVNKFASTRPWPAAENSPPPTAYFWGKEVFKKRRLSKQRKILRFSLYTFTKVGFEEVYRSSEWNRHMSGEFRVWLRY